MPLFTRYLQSSTDYPEGPRCPHRNHHTTGSLWPRVSCGHVRPGALKMLTPPPLTSEFVGMVRYAPTCFYELVDDEVESDGSSIGDAGPSHRPSRECAMEDALRQPPVTTESLQTHSPLDPRTETPVPTWEHGGELQ